jgi:hypothetical protein
MIKFLVFTEMKNNNKRAYLLKGLIILVCNCILLGSCSDDFLEPKPLSFFEPAATFTSESGLKATLAAADAQLRNTWINGESNTLSFEYRFSDVAVDGNTSTNNNLTDVATIITPTTFKSKNTFWWHDVYYSGIKFANTITTYIDNVEGLDEKTKNAYLGRAYFHRDFRYFTLVFQFNNVPLLTKICEVPKLDYRSTSRKAILEMIVQDMEFAVQHVPEQSEMEYIGMVNKGACRMLLIKAYLATGQWEKAKLQADALIEDSGYALMKETFGTAIESGEPETWKITRNVIWDMHRPENVLIAANKEIIYGLPDRGSGESFTPFHPMRAFGPFWMDANIVGPDGKVGASGIARSNAKYDKKYDYARVIGRGIANIRPTHHAQHGLWAVNGVEDAEDLRHSSSAGNWFRMDSLRYNDPTSTYYGKTYAEVPPTFKTNDTVRTWFDFPLYKIYYKDVTQEAIPTSVDFRGATLGGIADWYVYRLAEAYLLRAEAKFYQGDAGGAASDVNEIRKRAKCGKLYTTVTIGDIMDERARELYLEELRHVELSRVSLCLALSGKPDEWGNTYNVDTYDKQSGTDGNGGSYWYQRIIHYNNYYRNGNAGEEVSVSGKVFKYIIDKHNLYWPVPNDAITDNAKGKLFQNFGYDGYDAGTPLWENWQDAIADEDK